VLLGRGFNVCEEQDSDAAAIVIRDGATLDGEQDKRHGARRGNRRNAFNHQILWRRAQQLLRILKSTNLNRSRRRPQSCPPIRDSSIVSGLIENARRKTSRTDGWKEAAACLQLETSRVSRSKGGHGRSL
jgi:hypothetical protein